MNYLMIIPLLLQATPAGTTTVPPEKTENNANQVVHVEKVKFDRYNLVVDQNMFSKTRYEKKLVTKPRKKVERKPKPVKKQKNPYLVIRGIVQENDAGYVFIQDLQKQSFLRVKQSESIAGCTLEKLTLKEATFTFEGESQTVRIGETLALGDAFTEAAVQGRIVNYTSKASTSKSSSASKKPLSGKSSLLERLRRRRQQQVK